MGKEVLVDVSLSDIRPIDFDFDLGRLRGEEYVGVLDSVLSSDKYISITKRRHRICESIRVVSNSRSAVEIGLRKCDEKLAMMIYDALFRECIRVDRPDAMTCTNIYDFFRSFSGDEEKELMASRMMKLIFKVNMLSDIMMGYLKDLRSLRESLDKEQRILTFSGVIGAIGVLQTSLSGLARYKEEEKNQLFCDTCDSIEKYIDMRAMAFDKKVDAITKKKEKAADREREAKHMEYEERRSSV